MNQLLHLFLLSISFSGVLSNRRFRRCSQTFQCGNISNITYPFGFGDPPTRRFCTYPDFGLNCQGDTPILNISQLPYRVLEINFSNYTLKVARQDLWNTLCPEISRNTTLNSEHFKIAPYSNYQNITLYYNCTNSMSSWENHPNQFTCASSDEINMFKVGDASSSPEPGFTCSENIRVPVSEAVALELETPTANSSLEVLRGGLASGFQIQWSADNQICETCVKSSGACGYSWKSKSGACFYPHKKPRFGPGLIVLVATIGLASFILLCWCCKRSWHGKANVKLKSFQLEHGSLAPKKYKYSELRRITKSFTDKLGQGGYGSVYKGTLPDGCPVAVKVLTETTSNGEEFINEVMSISKTSHVNIVNLLGFCDEGNKRALVYEFMPNKSLDKFIDKDRNSGSQQLDTEQLYKIAIGVAKGLEYLHTGCNTRIVHFDIKPQNILLDEDFCPKISDFGLAKLCKKKHSVLSIFGTRGTIGYIAPELFSRNFGEVSHKSDIYSYGMMILEMVGARNVAEIEIEIDQSSENYFPDKIYEEAIQGIPIKLDDEWIVDSNYVTSKKMMLTGFWCIQTSPSDRPPVAKVVEILEGNLEAIQIPPKPVLTNPMMSMSKYSQSLSIHVETGFC